MKPRIRKDGYAPNSWICRSVEKTRFCNLSTIGSGKTPTEAYEAWRNRMLKGAQL